MERLARVFTWLVAAAGCGFPRPSPVGGADDGDNMPPSICTANKPLRCDGSNLVHCTSDGTAEVTEACTLGCSASPLHCNDIDPSNGLARYLDMAAGEPDLDLGMTAIINTSDGTVMVDGKSVVVRSALVAQPSAPTILVFIVHSLTANDVTIKGDVSGASGGDAFALASEGDIRIGGIFNASASIGHGGPGVYNDANCKGGNGRGSGSSLSGAGGGGFGAAGSAGGSASTDSDSATGGSSGQPTGTSTLIPLRGGCDSGATDDEHPRAVGSGGGAMQLVSRTKISIIGVVAANGSSLSGGGSGGGILIEAPIVEVTGSVVANGAGGNSGCLFATPGENGRLDTTPALGGTCSAGGAGGNGGAGAIAATDGASVHLAGPNLGAALAGHGGGGVGRIRINTAPGGFHRAGLFSPNPSTGPIATR
jgi:hypothetical protein